MFLLNGKNVLEFYKIKNFRMNTNSKEGHKVKNVSPLLPLPHSSAPQR